MERIVLSLEIDTCAATTNGSAYGQIRSGNTEDFWRVEDIALMPDVAVATDATDTAILTLTYATTGVVADLGGSQAHNTNGNGALAAGVVSTTPFAALLNARLPKGTLFAFLKTHGGSGKAFKGKMLISLVRTR